MKAIKITKQISLRALLAELLRQKNITIRELCRETGQGYPNMSRYLSGKRTLYADNVEKAINYCLKKNGGKASTLKKKRLLRELKQQALRQIAQLKKSSKYRLPQYENTASQKFKQAEISGEI